MSDSLAAIGYQLTVDRMEKYYGICIYAII